MNIVVAAVTVSFAGLVNFYAPSGQTGREVIVPKASSGVHRNVTLARHETTIVITKLIGGKKDCDRLSGIWNTTNESCTLSKVSGMTITLPPSTAGFNTTTNFDAIPQLDKKLCPMTITGIKKAYLTDPEMYAVRMTIAHGTLDACLNIHAWVSHLTTDAGCFSFGGTFVALDHGAEVQIINAPPGMSSGSSQEHFFWYYKMYEGAEECQAIPVKSKSPACPVGPNPALSGDVGCSNTNYP